MKPTWEESNQHGLSESLDRVFAAISRRDGNPPDSPLPDPGGAGSDSSREAKPATTALEQLERLFGLTPFERDILVLCRHRIGATLHRGLCHRGGRSRSAWPTFGLALSALSDPHWTRSAVTGRCALEARRARCRGQPAQESVADR